MNTRGGRGERLNTCLEAQELDAPASNVDAPRVSSAPLLGGFCMLGGQMNDWRTSSLWRKPRGFGSLVHGCRAASLACHHSESRRSFAVSRWARCFVRRGYFGVRSGNAFLVTFSAIRSLAAGFPPPPASVWCVLSCPRSGRLERCLG